MVLSILAFLDVHRTAVCIGLPIAQWLPVVLAFQVVLLLLCTWLAVRLATRPLARLANAAESLSPSKGGQRLQEGGPTEVANAVSAFNAMQDRIAQYLKERMQILAAISHDLQTPITRMKLRTEALDESAARDKLTEDLNEMQHLVREGVAYARSAQGAAEPELKVDLDAPFWTASSTTTRTPANKSASPESSARP